MKKLLSAILITAITVTTFGTSILAADSTKHNIQNAKKIVWEHAGDLEAQKGSVKNIGTAGILSGKSGNYIIVGGGANFPGEPAAVGGTKKLYSDIYILKESNGSLNLVEHTTLDHEIGYGSSITTEDGLYYVGGSSNTDMADDIYLFTVNQNGKLNSKKIGDLPFTLSDGIAVEKDKKIYVGLGKQDGKATNQFYEFDIATGETKELTPMPGADTRTQAVAQILNEKLYVFSGGDSIAYTDGYSYDFKNDTWTQVADVAIGKEKISLLGANSVKLNDNEMMVIGGFNKQVYDHAVKNLNSLQDEALAEFKASYFGADPDEFQWNKKVLIYNAKSNSWKTIGEIPFQAPCGQGLILSKDRVYSVNGEIKPGIRTNRMYSGSIVSNN